MTQLTQKDKPFWWTKLWGVLWRDEKKVDHDSNIGNSRYDQDIWSILWCVVPRSGLCVDVREKVGGICIPTIKGAW